MYVLECQCVQLAGCSPFVWQRGQTIQSVTTNWFRYCQRWYWLAHSVLLCNCPLPHLSAFNHQLLYWVKVIATMSRELATIGNFKHALLLINAIHIVFNCLRTQRCVMPGLLVVVVRVGCPYSVLIKVQLPVSTIHVQNNAFYTRFVINNLFLI